MLLKRCFHGFQFHGRLHQFRSLILYSTSSVASNSKDGSTNPLMVDFLAKSLGFSRDEAVSIVTNSKVSHRFKSTTKSELVVDFLKSSGFDESHIRKLVTDNPTVLRNQVEKTLKPKIRAFQGLGFSGSDLGGIISQFPHVLNRSLKDHVVPTLEMLKSFIGSNEQLITLLLKTKSQKMLSDGFLKNLPGNLLLLQSYGVPREKLKLFLLRRPLFFSSRTQWVEKIVGGVEGKLGVPRTSAMFLPGVAALSQTSDDRFKQWRRVFLSYGWSEAEISKSLRSYPKCLTRSEKALRVKLKYYTEDLGCGSDYLAAHPVLLSYSMEKRIVPRNAVIKALKDNKLLKRNVSIITIMNTGESQFVEKYVLPFKDKWPQLFEYYMQTTGRALSLLKHSLPLGCSFDVIENH